MSRRVHQGPFAVVSDGTLLLNVAHFARGMKHQELLRVALSQPGELFVGVRMTRAEAARVLNWSADIHAEAVAYIVGKRQRQSRRKDAAQKKTRR